MPANRQLGNVLRLVSRVVQDLNLEQLLGIVHLADCRDQAVRDVHFVEDGELDCDWRQYARLGQWLRRPTLVFHVKINEVIAMPAVNRQNAEDKEVRDQNQCLRQAHKKMNPSRRTIGDSIALRSWKSTHVKYLESSAR